MVVGFKVKVNSLNRESVLFWDGSLRGDDSKIVATTYTTDPTSYRAILQTFPDNEILKAPSDDFMGNKKLRVF